MAKTEKIQKTLTVQFGGETIVSNPFDFEAADMYFESMKTSDESKNE